RRGRQTGHDRSGRHHRDRALAEGAGRPDLEEDLRLPPDDRLGRPRRRRGRGAARPPAAAPGSPPPHPPPPPPRPPAPPPPPPPPPTPPRPPGPRSPSCPAACGARCWSGPTPAAARTSSWTG